MDRAAAVQAAAQPAIDDVALRAYRKRLREVAAAIAEAEDDVDLGRWERRQNGREPPSGRRSPRRPMRSVTGMPSSGPSCTAVITGLVCRYEPTPGSAPWRVTSLRAPLWRSGDRHPTLGRV
jgi:hypothetical protein